MFQFILSEKPSLGRVAVSALYGDCDRKTKHMKGQRNRHTSTPFRVVWRNRLFRIFALATPARSGAFILHDPTGLVNEKL